MTSDKSPRQPESPKYHSGKIVGSCVAAILAIFGIDELWSFVKVTANGYKAEGAEGQLVAYSITLWFLPLGIAAAMIIFAFGLRSIVSKTVLGIAVLLLAAGVVTAITGAQ